MSNSILDFGFCAARTLVSPGQAERGGRLRGGFGFFPQMNLGATDQISLGQITQKLKILPIVIF
jgi:hypothetical protein